MVLPFFAVLLPAILSLVAAVPNLIGPNLRIFNPEHHNRALLPHDPDFQSSVRRAFPSDVQQQWLLEEVVNNYPCPQNITHTTWQRLPSGIIALRHNSIIQDGARCESEGTDRRLEFYESQNYDVNLTVLNDNAPLIPPTLENMLTGTGTNINIRFDLNQFGEDYLFGYEPVIRVCDSSIVFQSGTTAFISRPFSRPFSMTGVNTRFQPGYRYMLMVPRYEDAICVYSVNVEDPSSEPSPEPSGEPFITPVAPTPDIQSQPSPEPSLDVQATASTGDDSDSDSESACFPADSLVTLQDGSSVPMASLSIGDHVAVAPGVFSPVHAFTHRDSKVHSTFVQLELSSGHVMRVSRGHFLLVNGQVKPAHVVVVKDEIPLGNGQISHVVKKTLVRAKGLYNPQTTDGTIVVDGVMATTYTTAVSINMAHALLTPLRALFKVCRVDPLPMLMGVAGWDRSVL